MSEPEAPASSVYHHPRYYAIGYQWNTEAECDFLQACLKRYGAAEARRVLDIGCGSGRHVMELARRGYHVTGFDLRPEMIAFLNEESRKASLSVKAFVGDMLHEPRQGGFDLAICLMDTFRFLLTNEQLISQLRRVGERLSPGGLYITDFWIPRQWDQIANEVYQWEQTREGTTVRVFYLQHPETADPVQQTFEDELVFVVEEEGVSREIRGERTRTRLILPQEFRLLVEASGLFDLAGTFVDLDLHKPLGPSAMTWRMVSVLKKRP